VLGGRRVTVQRPRVRSKKGEVPLPSWERLAAEDPLHARAVEQMVLGVATRKYARSLEPLPAETKSRGTSKSAVSRRFVAATEKTLADWLGRSLSGLSLAALMLDGIVCGEHTVLVALGIDEGGQKHVLGLWEGATENAVACTALLASLAERGLDVNRTMLVVIDGAKALAKAVRDTFGNRALIQRCQVHKKRNVLEHLPERMRATTGATISTAYGCRDSERALSMLTKLARQLERKHPSAAASLREGLSETLTIISLKLDDALARTLATTNPIENLNGVLRRIHHNVKRWRDGTMVLRWVAVGLHEAMKGFRRLKGHEGMPKLVAALRAHDDVLLKEKKENPLAALKKAA
jgi:transposase-like protein